MTSSSNHLCDRTDWMYVVSFARYLAYNTSLDITVLDIAVKNKFWKRAILVVKIRGGKVSARPWLASRLDTGTSALLPLTGRTPQSRIEL
jgi:hypothetical protein